MITYITATIASPIVILVVAVAAPVTSLSLFQEGEQD